MTEEEYAIANRILNLVVERHKRQIEELQQLLGVSEGFEKRVRELWKQAINA